MSLLPGTLSAALDPSPDEARRELRRELAQPEYDHGNPLTRLLDWIARQFDSGVEAAADTPLLTTLAAMIVFALLVAGLAVLASRARRTARSIERSGPLGVEMGVSASDYRTRAQTALAADDFHAAVIDGFRALATQQVESGRIENLPQATAREVSALVTVAHPDHAAELAHTSALFDATLYGDHPAGRDDAVRVLSLDDLLGVRR